MSKYRYADRAKALKTKTTTVDHQVYAPEDTIQLMAANPLPDELPEMMEEAIRATRDFRTETMQYGPAYGLDELRDWIVDYVQSDGVKCNRDNILMVNGAKQGIDLACKIFMNPGDSIVVTLPTYFTSLGLFRGYEAEFVGVEQDQEGMIMDQLEEKLKDLQRKGKAMPKLLFDVPDFHNPSSITMSQARRQRLVELAERYNFMVIEDDPYRPIRFEGEAVPPIKAFDQSGHVIACGTFSKMLAPGPRVGWVIAAPEIISRMSALKSDGGSCPLTQRIVFEAARSGRLQQHVEDLTQVMRSHRDAMYESLQRHLPDAKARKPEGGYFLWLRLPEHIDTERLYEIALGKGVKILPGKYAFAVESPPSNFARLAFSYENPKQIEEGIRRLALAYQEMK